MAYVISDDCISCGTCEGECPVGAISMGADHYEIDPMHVQIVVLVLVFARLKLSNRLKYYNSMKNKAGLLLRFIYYSLTDY